jgi:hypothetical protein
MCDFSTQADYIEWSNIADSCDLLQQENDEERAFFVSHMEHIRAYLNKKQKEYLRKEKVRLKEKAAYLKKMEAQTKQRLGTCH